MRHPVYSSRHALRLLRRGTGIPDAAFRPGQEEAIRHVVAGRGRLLVVQKTGWGKSFVYFIATRLLRKAGKGPAILVSPLLSLMRNQIAAARRMRVRAEKITSDNQEDWPAVEKLLQRDQVDILLIAPERLANNRFQSDVLPGIGERASLLVIDECHCISDWGHDFRPHYRLIKRFARTLPRNVRLLATTATANDRVMNDLRDVLGPDLAVQRGELARPSLALQTIRMPRQSERLAWLAQTVPRLHRRHGIIYTLTVRDAKMVAAWLRSRGMDVRAYTGKMEPEEREALEDALLKDSVKALVATVALGMGFDKRNLGFVIHYQAPGSVVAYYQQVGRAGRAVDAAYGVLLSGEEETDITDHFIRSAFPTREEVNEVISTLEAAPAGLSVPEIAARVNLSEGRIGKTTELLSLESPAPFVKDGTKWRRTHVDVSDAFWKRVDRLTDLRRAEQRQMQDYVDLESGHMDFLIEALAFLQRLDLPIPPRKRWPGPGGLPHYRVKGNIAQVHRAEEGRALCYWGDGGWGEMVRDGKYQDGKFPDELLDACVSLLSRWDPKPSPTWVTCVPSLRSPDLVPEFTGRLAGRLGLPFVTALRELESRPEQKSMANSTHQALNRDGSFAVHRIRLPSDPVLLVDDIVGSRWTFTVAAWLLRRHGSGQVRPLALASLGRG